MEYHLKFAFTEQEYADYNVWTVWSAPWQKKTRLKYTLRQFLSLAVWLGAVYFLFNDHEGWNYNWQSFAIIFAIACVIILLMIRYLVPFRIANRAKKFLRREENTNLLQEKELTIDETGILSIDSISRNAYNWTAVSRFSESGDAYYIFLDGSRGFIIPKRIFKSSAERTAFAEFVSGKIPLQSSFRSL